MSEQASFLPQRAIGPFNATVTIEESVTDELEITQIPVQQGAAITDHAYVKPVVVNVKVAFDAATDPLPTTYNKLLQLQASRVPLALVTGKRSFENMLIKSMVQINDVMTENSLAISLQLQEIIITAVEMVSVPAREKQKNAGKTGAEEKSGEKSATETKEPQSQSVIGRFNEAFSGQSVAG